MAEIDLKQLYEIAKEINHGEALKMARQAKTAEERKFYAFISDMNLQRAQKKAIENKLF